ncbi:MAG: MBL fold metallo-hydrolase [Deltaproteobacteria bacterium]
MMKITKFGHCCFGVEENGVRILTDPGNYSTGQNQVKGINIILITHHEHQDHLFFDSLNAILRNNLSAKIITNRSVATRLESEHIPSTVLEDGQTTSETGVLIEGIGRRHSVIYPDLPSIHNTGYFISNRLFYPGDAFTNPQRPVGILALPLAAPWLKLSEAIHYAKEVRPNICFPVHDGNVRAPESIYRVAKLVLEPLGIKFVVLEPGKEMSF